MSHNAPSTGTARPEELIAHPRGPPNQPAPAPAYGEVGQFDDSVAEQDRAIEMLRAVGRHDKATDFQTHLDLYRSRKPYRE